MNLTKQSEIQKYRLVMILFMGVGIVLLCGSIWTCVKASPSFPHLFLGILGGLFLVLGIQQLLGLSKGTVVFTEKRVISLRTGEIVFDEPTCPYELWIFCETPFSRYYGSIHMVRNFTEQEQIIKVPRHNAWLLWWWCRPRSDVSPLIWKSPAGGAHVQTRCSIKFNLMPAFANTILDKTYPTHEVESVTVLIKTAQCSAQTA
jgi:hypothetical protein